MKSAPFEYLRAADAAAAVAGVVEAGEGAKFCAGSQSLGAMLNLRLAQVDRLVDVSRIAALRGTELQADCLRIGSAVTHARIEDGELPDVTLGLLPSVAAHIAYRAVRNRGTIGGSLAHADPAADWVSVSCLLDARMHLLGPAGERTLPTSEFFLGPFTTALAHDELIVAVDMPRFSPSARWAYRKVCRKPGEFAEALAALWIDPAKGIARALIGALSGMPQVVSGSDAVDALRQSAGVTRLLDDAGVDDGYERDLLAEMLRLAFADLATFPPAQP